MTSHEDKSDVVNPEAEAEQASKSGRYIFRGDDEYRGGSLGFGIASKQAFEADIQTPWEHVSKKESYQTSRYISFSERIRMSGNRGAIFFTKKRIIIKVSWDTIKQLESQGTIKVYTPADVESIMLQQKRKISKRAQAVRDEMEKNGEILIEGQLPEEILIIVNNFS